MADIKVPVSVVIPTHNSESTIERALESVFAQSAQPFEVIVVDDASSDGTYEMVNQIAQRVDIPLRLHSLSENLGPSFTRNVGWDLASSDYVAFLDSDDSWHPQKLEVQFQWMAEHPEHEMSGHLTGRPAEVDPKISPTVRSFGLVDLLWRNRVSTPTVMVKRSVIERFDTSRWYAEDYELWMRIVSRIKTLPRIELPLALLHKADYGDSGLSANLSKMFLGELSALVALRHRGFVSILQLSFFASWMTMKFIVRVTRSWARRWR